MATRTDETLQALRAAAKGLTFESESSEPVKAFLWTADGVLAEGPPNVEALRTREKFGDEVPVDEKAGPEAVDDLFAPMTAEQDWHGAEEKEASERFRALVAALKSSLKDLRVFRAGEVEIDAYVVGRTEDGDLAGVRTRLTET